MFPTGYSKVLTALCRLLRPRQGDTAIPITLFVFLICSRVSSNWLCTQSSEEPKLTIGERACGRDFSVFSVGDGSALFPALRFRLTVNRADIALGRGTPSDTRLWPSESAPTPSPSYAQNRPPDDEEAFVPLRGRFSMQEGNMCDGNRRRFAEDDQTEIAENRPRRFESKKRSYSRSSEKEAFGY